MSMQQGRTGISPLIAEVLLIAFTMAVAAILTAWFTGFTQEQTAQLGNESARQIDCSVGLIKIFSTDTTSNWVNATVENSGQEHLENVSGDALSGGSVLGTGFIEDLKPGEIDDTAIKTEEPADTLKVVSENCPTVSTSASL